MIGRWLHVATVFAVGCSFVNDPNDHRGGAADGGLDSAIEAVDATSGEAIAAERFCAAHAEVLCDAYFRCCARAAPTAEMRTSCVTNATARCDAGTEVTLNGLLRDPRTNYDPALAAEVIADLRSETADCSLTFADFYAARSGFWRIFAGTRSAGSDCTPESTGGRFDYGALFSCRDGDRCLAVSADEWVCADSGGNGDRCVVSLDCEAGKWCDTTAVTGSVCADRRDDRSACTADEQCESMNCSALICMPRSRESVYCGGME